MSNIFYDNAVLQLGFLTTIPTLGRAHEVSGDTLKDIKPLSAVVNCLQIVSLNY